MKPALIALLAFVLIAAVIAIGAHAAKVARLRREALAALAARLGWRFDPAHDRSHDERFRQFDVFRQGHSRAAYNTLEGEIEAAGRRYGGRMGDFTYKVTRSNGKTTTTTTYNFSYLILRPPFGGTPELHIRPENVLDKLAGALGFDDIDFESSEFSRSFHVRCGDKRFAYDVISPRMMEFLLASEPGSLAMSGGCCLLSEGGKRWEPESFERRLGWMVRFFELWPEFLLEQLESGGRPDGGTA